MRPLMLRFQAFGAYPGLHEVDFEALGRRGLFLVTGPTGTGKSTVFDAMVFALYGKLPGARADGGEARSHYVADDVESFVDFTFEADGNLYRVHRTPTWHKAPKKDGGNPIRQGGKATLVRLVPGGTEPIAEQTSRVTAECETIVGLKAEQFQRVVLLPQGEFTKFLVAGEEARQELLRRLFAGDLYDKATQLLDAKMRELDALVSVVDNQIEHHRANAVASVRSASAELLPEAEVADDASLEQLQAAVQELEPVRAAQQGVLDERREAAARAEREATMAKEAAGRFDEAERLTGLLATLNGEAAEVDTLKKAVEASRRGAEVVEAGKLVARAETDLDAKRTDFDEVLQRVVSGFSAMSEPMPDATSTAVTEVLAALASTVRNERQLVKAALDAQRKASDAEAKAQAAAEALDTHRESLRAADARVTDLATQLEALDPVASAVAVLVEREQALSAICEQRAHLDEAMAELPGAEADAQRTRDHSYEVMSAFIATQAPRLAAELVDGQPCSVCGSTVHPKRARHSAVDVVDHDQVEAARQAETEATKRRGTVESRIRTLSSTLGQAADETLESLKAQLAGVAGDLRKAREAASEVGRLRPMHDAAQSERTEADNNARAAEVALAEDNAAAATKRGEADRISGEAAAVDLDRLERREQSLAGLDGVGHQLGTAQQGVTAAEAALSTQRSAAESALHRSGFSSAHEAAAAFIGADSEQQAAGRVEEWVQAKQTADTQLEQLRKLGVPSQRPDAEALAGVASATRSEADDLARRVTGASNEFERAVQSIGEALNAGSGSLELRAERDDARIVFQTCNGKAGMRVKLERWVLSGELERVTQAANVHLARMSNGRYRLGRKGGRSALDIEVFDSNTGRARATTSLSGGEQFQASLSLALGLADVVSHGGTASGKLFEALFVDEGFGSLDPKALDQAIEALLMIQAGGRMVGAITHVEAMKERLHTGIEVSAREDGKGSTLTVNP